MEDIKYDIKEGEILSRVAEYFLHRKNEDSVTIEVYQPVAPFSGRFLATPILKTQSEKNRFTGTGGTEEEALSELISLIKDVPSSDLE